MKRWGSWVKNKYELYNIFVFFTSFSSWFWKNCLEIKIYFDFLTNSLWNLSNFFCRVVSEMLEKVREYIGSLHKLAECVSMLDMLVSLAHACSLSNYGEQNVLNYFSIIYENLFYGRLRIQCSLVRCYKIVNVCQYKWRMDFHSRKSVFGDKTVYETNYFLETFLYWLLL